MKEIKIKMLVVIFAIAAGLSSCLKKAPANTDIDDKTGTIMELQFVQSGGSTINSGMQYFSGGALSYASTDDVDTANYNISLAGPVTLSKDVAVTIGVDPSKALDNFSSDSINYEVMPDSLYSFVSTTATIKAGTRIANMQIVFYPSKVDPTKSYILPVVIKNASGQTISSNFSTIYIHIIGNPLAGAYTMTGTRYNFSGGVTWSGPPDIPAGNVGTTPYSATIVAVPVNAVTVQLVMGNVPDPVSGSAMYLITGVNNFADITYTFPSSFLNGYSVITKYVVSYTPPTATDKAAFHLMTKYNNTTGGAGNDRLIDQTFTHQ